jgi:cell division protein ZapA
MSRVEVVLAGRAYTLACDDGQEDRLRRLVGVVDTRLRDLIKDGVGGGDAQRMLLVALMLADELMDLQEDLSTTRRSSLAEDDGMIAVVDTLSRRIEDIALRLERA